MQPTPPTPPTPPTAISIQTTEGGVVIGAPAAGSAQGVYEGYIAQRKELRNQLDRLQDERRDVADRLRHDELNATDKIGQESRLIDLDSRIKDVEQQIAKADAAVAQAAAVPGAVVEPKPIERRGPPDEVFAIPIVFTIFVLAPIAIAYARRIWKRPLATAAAVPRELTERIDAMSQAVESIAVEVERIGEGQRFITKVMGERQLGPGAAQPISVPQADRAEARR